MKIKSKKTTSRTGSNDTEKLTVSDISERYQSDSTSSGETKGVERHDNVTDREELGLGETDGFDLSGEGTLSFADIQPGMFVNLRGKEGYVVDKGNHIMPDTESSHIQVWFTDSKNRDKFLHEGVVNRWLNRGTDLWVDWSDMTNSKE